MINNLNLSETIKLCLNGGAIIAVIYLSGQIKGLTEVLKQTQVQVATKAGQKEHDELKARVDQIYSDLYAPKGN
ncbi:hypothetical protein HG263_05420 [Pseudoalteromonas sp. JBTF-M23]|uniref:Uncharacterized protein n=1 Tax=Pseudoalteromonas caenipelagi TaxID=2726988 RepID=A0A849VAJ9_9GAMM|nr:hypothetical protein [Pseudoalteromonas caenipelagi]NOU49975.1 hypothetical protein [Pseudoalteromonas caenipelagi]